MCTIIVRHGLDAPHSTVVASNRDEFFSRSASPPLLLGTDPRIVGGRDDDKGGTWFGLTPSGLFVGLTNQRNYAGPDDSLRSRGELVLEALRAGSHEGVAAFLQRTDARLYNEFNVIFGDGTNLAAGYGRRSRSAIELEFLSAGVHVLCNDRLGSPEFPKAEGARTRVLSISSRPWPELQSELAQVLADTSLPDPAEVPQIPQNPLFDQELARRLQAICVQTPVYGTVSSTIVAVRPGAALEYHHASGPPSDVPYRDFTHLIRP